MEREVFDVCVVGAGIVGLATARALIDGAPKRRVVVLEKEDHLGAHQTGRNSGVIHSGIYYKPGSLKSRLCTEGNAAMFRFADEHGVANERCGKLIVASTADELARLDGLVERAAAAGIEVSRVAQDEIAAYEPNVVGLGGLWIPSTGIIDYVAVLGVLADLVRQRDGDIRLSTKVERFERADGLHVVETSNGPVRARRLVTCGGLQSDRLAVAAGATLPDRIVPFRGEYFELAPHRRHLVKGLVYPVPDPNFPFLGVHFTRMIDGSVHAGPNAVLALAREGYRKRDIRLRDISDVITFPGFWRLARKHARAGTSEMARSFSKRLFLRSLRVLIPEVELDDLVPSEAGVRAQLLAPSGQLVDDFRIVRSDGALHVCNAPSPAATSSLQIGAMIAAELEGEQE